jgi:hypothetical protein
VGRLGRARRVQRRNRFALGRLGSPEELFGTSILDLTELTDRPLAITVGFVEQGGDKSQWIQHYSPWRKNAMFGC